jgi:hypothetical protein
MAVNRVSVQVYADASGGYLIINRAYTDSGAIAWTRSYSLSSKDAAKMPTGPFNLGASLQIGQLEPF